MLRTCQIDRAAVGGAALGTARRSASGRIVAAGRPPWSCRRSWDDPVADNVAPKRRSTNRLRLVSPKTCFATARPTRQNATERDAASDRWPVAKNDVAHVGQEKLLANMADMAILAAMAELRRRDAASMQVRAPRSHQRCGNDRIVPVLRPILADFAPRPCRHGLCVSLLRISSARLRDSAAAWRNRHQEGEET